MKNLIILLTLCSLLAQCTEKNNTTPSPNEKAVELSSLPSLLDRSERIRNGREWDDVQNAYSDMRAKIISNPAALEARLEMAQLFTREARVTGEHGHYYPASLSLINQIIDAKPANQDLIFRTLSTKASVQLSLHNFSEALQTGQAALKLNPYNAQIYGVLTDAYVELGQYEKAIETADKMTAIRPDLRSYSRISYLREIHNDLPGAIDAMEQAVAAGYPGFEETAWAQLTLAELYIKNNQSIKADQLYDLILLERPDYPFAIAGKGNLAIRKNQSKEGEKYLKDAMDVIPEVGFYVDLASLYKNQGRQTEMQSLIDEIFEMLADDVVNGHNMNLEYAQIYRDLIKDNDAARKYAKREFAKRPDNKDVKKLLASLD